MGQILNPAFLGVVVALVTAVATWQANLRARQSHREEQARLKLEAAMRAGELLSAGDDADPAAIASGLLALTRLDQADLAVALLVDLWSNREPSAVSDGCVLLTRTQRVSTETAILVIDAAPSSPKPSAQLVAAELLCRNAERLNPGQALHWPSCIEGTWNPLFGPKSLLVNGFMRALGPVWTPLDGAGPSVG